MYSLDLKFHTKIKNKTNLHEIIKMYPNVKVYF